METRRPHEKLREDFRSFTGMFAYAVIEWLLIFFLYFNALLSYATTKVARIFDLQIPCLFCSRLDHIIGNEAPGFCRELICHAHKLEISSLIYCRIHEKLSDARGLCEDCLVSFVKEEKSSAGKSKLLAENLRMNCEDHVEDNCNFHPYEELRICSRNKVDAHVEEVPDYASRYDFSLDSRGVRCCRCCGVPVRSKLSPTGIPTTSSIGSKIGTLDVSSSCSVLCHHHDRSSKESERSSGSSRDSSLETHNNDLLAHVGYSELNSSEEESEVPFSVEDDPHVDTRGTFDYKIGQTYSSVQKFDSIKTNMSSATMTSDLNHKKQESLAIPTSKLNLTELETPFEVCVASFLVSEEQPECNSHNHSSNPCYPVHVTRGPDERQQEPVLRANEHEDASSSTLSVTFGHGLDELNWQEISASLRHPMEFSTPCALLSSNKDTEVCSGASLSTTLRVDLSQAASDKALKVPSETVKFPALDEFFTPRAVWSSIKLVEAPSETTLSSSLPEFFTPHAAASSNNCIGTVLAELCPSQVPEFFTPRAIPPSIRSVEAPSDVLNPFEVSESSRQSMLASSNKAVEALGEEYASKCVNDVTDRYNYFSEMASEFTYNTIGIKKLDGLARLKVFEPSCSSNQATVDPTLLMSGSLDLDEAYGLAMGDKISRPSESFADVNGKEPSRIPEDLKLLLMQMPALRGRGDIATSPKIQVGNDKFRVSNAPNPNGAQAFYKRLSVESNESVGEFLNGNILSEIDGESAIDHLKRQVEFDRKAIHGLYKELEEERNASAIAVNQAMAMITRLQEEKAAMHMEALQYQRLMEEQAEYDQEALQKANELLTMREKEIQDLEAELELVRNGFESEPKLEQRVEDLKHGFHEKVNSSLFASYFPHAENLGGKDLHHEQRLNDKSMPILKDNVDLARIIYEVNGREETNFKEQFVRNFENEQRYLLRCLKNLENRLDEINFKETEHTKIARGHDIEGEEDFSTRDNSFIAGRELSSKRVRFLPLVEPSDNDDLPTANCDCDLQNSTTFERGNGIFTIEGEESHVIERLDSLEVEHDFLEHIINVLRSGNDGLKFVQEIAHYLREMRRIWIEAAVAPRSRQKKTLSVDADADN